MFDIDFRNYADLIRKAVKEANERDPNWKWSVHSLTKRKVLIRWGYLDYLEEQHLRNCFSITIDYPKDEELWNTIAYRLPEGNFLGFCDFGDKSWNTHSTIEQAILAAISRLVNYAHIRY